MREARLEEAFRCFEKAVRSEPENAAAWKRRGQALGMMGFFLEAADSFAQASVLNVSDREAWMCRGFCLAREFRYQEAMSCFGQVMRIYPEDGYARYWCDLLKEETIGGGLGLGRAARLKSDQAIDFRG